MLTQQSVVAPACAGTPNPLMVTVLGLSRIKGTTVETPTRMKLKDHGVIPLILTRDGNSVTFPVW